MADYSKTKMYKLVSDNLPPDMVYYGHTVQRLSERKRTHVAHARPDSKRNCTSRIIIEAGAYRIVWLEDWPCANVREARTRERWWIENNPCVNLLLPSGKTTKEYRTEWCKKYREVHKEELKEYHKEWYGKNCTAIKEKRKEKFLCYTCQTYTTVHHRYRHTGTCYKRFCNAFGIDAYFDGLKVAE